ncbi:MAG: hypothetical protein F6K32_19370 [Desertifilum sp. SIO1I2]|nr:hypothetical protein [Desertifilum sp. SIO1I2]
MTSPNVPRNAYTHSPEQHPNLIIGSLQLLFWLFFRPSAWESYLGKIDPALVPISNQASRLHWRNKALFRLLIQAYLILPIIINLIFIFVSALSKLSLELILIKIVLALLIPLILSIFFLISFALLKKYFIFSFILNHQRIFLQLVIWTIR